MVMGLEFKGFRWGFETYWDVLGLQNGARYWTRTSDPRHVMAVLYQLS